MVKNENLNVEILEGLRYISNSSTKLNECYFELNNISLDEKISKINLLLQNISEMGKQELQESLAIYKDYCDSKIGKFVTVEESTNPSVPITNFLRYLIIDEILKKKEMDYIKYSELKEKVFSFESKADYDYFKTNYNDNFEDLKKILDVLQNNSAGKTWVKKDFEILAGIYMTLKIKNINNYLTKIGQFIIAKLNFKESSQSLKLFSFMVQGYIRPWAFLAIHPTTEIHQDSYQIAVKLNGDLISYGLFKGANLTKKDKEKLDLKEKLDFVPGYFEDQNLELFNADQLIEYLETKIKPEYLKLNAELNSNIIKTSEFIIENNVLNKKVNSYNLEDERRIEEIIPILKNKNQIILYGPPGTAKTWITKEIVRKMSGKSYDDLKKEHRAEFITFHQSYAYEEFVEGIKPSFSNTESQDLQYIIQDGLFKQISLIAESNFFASQNPTELKPYFLIIDEINRGNISKILGELITLLESNKRLEGDEELLVTLPYSRKPFGVPKNLYIIATMNTADRSIANLDIALRRRFGFYEMAPNYDFIDKNNKLQEINLSSLLRNINNRIELILDKDHLIGASYFANIEDIGGLKRIWYSEVIPLLQEYFYNDWVKLKFVIGKAFIEEKQHLFTPRDKDVIEEDKIIYKLRKFTDDQNNQKFISALTSIIDGKDDLEK